MDAEWAVSSTTEASKWVANCRLCEQEAVQLRCDRGQVRKDGSRVGREQYN